MAQTLEQRVWKMRGSDSTVVVLHIPSSSFLSLSSSLSISPQVSLFHGGCYLHRVDICLRPVFDNLYTKPHSFDYTITAFLIPTLYLFVLFNSLITLCIP